MLNPDLKLNQNIFKPDVAQAATREGYGEGLLLAGRADVNVVALCSDLTKSTQMDLFAKEFPARFIETGVAEQNMASVASGMAAMGKIPFIASYAMFSPGRNWEQIRTTICYNGTNVKIAGAHAGISVGPDGGTHQALEDIALTRVIPKMTVIYPCDAIEAKKATLAAAKIKGPVYIRLAREKTPVITTPETPFGIGQSEIYWQGTNPKVGIIATGPLLYNALLAAHELDKEGISVSVMNLATIKPLPEADIVHFAESVQGIVTVEEHQIAGGMGSAVAEVLAQARPTKIAFIGVRDQFGQSGTPDELLTHYGMGVTHIKEAVKKLI